MSDHGATICTTGRHGCWALCVCGWKSGLWTTATGASLAFAEHLRDPDPTTARAHSAGEPEEAEK